MKKLLLLSCVLLISYIGFSQVTLTTQAEVDAYAGGSTVSGDLTIGLDGGSDITSLANLGTITSVTGFVWIHKNPNLTNLSGLDNLESVNILYIGDNPELLDMDALSTSLTSIGGYFSIYRNGKLTSLSGLSGITNLNLGFYFEGCPLILDFSDLIGLTSLDGRIEVVNSGITSLNGLLSITSLSSYILIDNNDLLTDLSILENLKTIGSALVITNNLLIPDFNWLGSLTTVAAYLDISGNGAITSLDGLNLLNSIGDFLLIKGNPELNSLNGIEALTNLDGAETANTGRIQIDANAKLNDISGMANIDSNDITYLTIRNNALLSTCEISNVCSYVGGAGPRIVSGNDTGCQDNTAILAACASLSTSEYIIANALSVYPNPVDDVLHISKLTSIDIQNIQLYNAQGALVKQSNMVDDQLDVSEFSPGLYLLKIATNDGIAIQKLIIQ